VFENFTSLVEPAADDFLSKKLELYLKSPLRSFLKNPSSLSAWFMLSPRWVPFYLVSKVFLRVKNPKPLFFSLTSPSSPKATASDSLSEAS